MSNQNNPPIGHVEWHVEATPHDMGANGHHYSSGTLPAADVARELRSLADRIERYWSTPECPWPQEHADQPSSAGDQRMSTRTYEVDPSDPHNDQMAAQTAEDLATQLGSVHHVLDQAEENDAPLSTVLAVIVHSLVDQAEVMPRERLASLLALALVRLAAEERA